MKLDRGHDLRPQHLGAAGEKGILEDVSRKPNGLAPLSTKYSKNNVH